MTEDKRREIKKSFATFERIFTKIIRWLTKPMVTLLICFILGFFLVRGAFRTTMTENNNSIQREIQK